MPAQLFGIFEMWESEWETAPPAHISSAGLSSSNKPEKKFPERYKKIVPFWIFYFIVYIFLPPSGLVPLKIYSKNK